jgi:hypothetical protein
MNVYYRKLFLHVSNSFYLVEECNLEISQLSNEENGIFTSNFKEEGCLRLSPK